MKTKIERVQNFIREHQRILTALAAALDCLIDFAIARVFNLPFALVFTADTALSLIIVSIPRIIWHFKVCRYFKDLERGYVDPVMCEIING